MKTTDPCCANKKHYHPEDLNPAKTFLNKSKKDKRYN